MPGPRPRRSFALVMSIVAVLACGDYARSTSPPPTQRKLLPPTLVVRSSFWVTPQGFMAPVVRWGSAHQRVEQSVSGLIGPEGGRLSLPGADFSMTIPAGALMEPTTITVVAEGGPYVVYDMLPHGLRFRQHVIVVQGLSTIASYGWPDGNSVRTAYLSDGSEQISYEGFASPAEMPAATTYFYGAVPVAETQEWFLNHFSRYILISGVLVLTEDD
jgi:hypothetical protein